MKQDLILVIEAGGNDSSGLARQIRAAGVYSEIHPHDMTTKQLNSLPNVKGIIINSDGTDKYAASESILKSSIPTIKITSAISDKQLKKFLFDKCACQTNWNMQNFIDDQIELIRNQTKGKKVILALSGGVDSSVVAALLIKAIGDDLTCVHVNHGLLRKGEPEQVVEVFKKQLGANLVYVDAAERFLSKLDKVKNPEKKRKIIGKEFIRVFEEESAKLDGIEFLAQGTIYPDIVESGTKVEKSVKPHHNVGGLPKRLKFKLVEPLKYLFKDEVRACGIALGLPEDMVYRQPFPGPGLGVRCLGAITPDRLEAVRESDAILREEFAKAGLEGKVWQYFTLIPDYRSVGVRNNAGCFEYPVIIRAVNTVDAMTAEIETPNWKLLQKITSRIITEVKGVNRVCYDLTPKPTGTIEWE